MAKKQNKTGDYKVGYGNPPREHQFKPGQSGNPSGRRKREASPRSVASYLAEELMEPVRLIENGKAIVVPAGKVLAKKMLRDALAGDAMDRMRFTNHLGKHNIDWLQADILSDRNRVGDDEQAILEGHRRFLEDARRKAGFD